MQEKSLQNPKDSNVKNKQQFLVTQKPLIDKKFLSKEEQEQLDNRFLGAAKSGDNAAIGRLLEAGADINASGPSNKKYTALHFAVLNKHLHTCRLLLERGIAVDARSNDGETALMLAAVLGNIQLCVLLLEKGADIGARILDCWTVTELAETSNNKKEFAAFLRLMESVGASMSAGGISAFLSDFRECANQ